MYHRVKDVPDSNICTAATVFEMQLQYLQKAGYQSIFINELNNPLTKKPCIITFDDGYTDNLEIIQPLLIKYGMKATIFIPSSKMGVDEDKMTVQQLKTLNRSVFDLALHSHKHDNFENMALNDIAEDLRSNMSFFEQHQIPYQKALAYPYGKYPKSREFFALLEKTGIQYGFRIGNRINTFPFKNNFQISRLDVDGFTSVSKFKRKLYLGKSWF